jgi:outer membrane protein insertion porin family
MNKHPLRLLCLVALSFLMAAGFCFAQDGDAWYMGKTIKSVEFKGLKAVSKSDVEGIVKPYIGKAFSDSLFLELQSKVNDSDYFESVSPVALPGDKENKTIIIRFDVVEKDVIDSVKFEGNASIKTLDLIAVVTSKAGDLAKKIVIASDEDEVRKLYLGKGYSAIQVRSEMRKTDKGIALHFIIDEGKQIVVKTIRITGTLAFSEKTLKSKLPLKEQNLFNSGAFQEDKIEESIQTILDYYKNRGYIDAAVARPEITQEPDEKKKRNNASVTFSVTEGQQYTYAGVKFEGNVVFTTQKLSELVLQKPGQLFNNGKFKADMERIRNLYYSNGYVFSQIDNKEERQEADRSITYVIKIVERDRAHVSDIQVKGNTKTKERVILRELPIESGDIFSRSKVEQGLRNLLNLQYFSSIYPEIIPVSEQVVDLVLTVTEQSTAGFNFGLTYVPATKDSNTIPIGGFVKWDDTNFLGNGQNFSAGTEFTADTQSLTFAFTENWLADRRWQGGVSLSFSHKQVETAQDILAPIFPTAVPDPYESLEEYKQAGYSVPDEYKMTYDSISMGAGLNTGYTFKFGLKELGLKVGANANLENILYDDDKFRPYDESLQLNHNTWLLSDFLTLYQYWNTLDVYANPTSGYVVTNKFTLSGFTSLESQQYLREDIKVEAFLTLLNIPITESWRFKMILGGHSSYTALFQKPGIDLKVKSGNYPAIDGMMTMRGWSGLSSVNATGIFYNWIELRMPIVEQYLWLDLFLDAAAVQSQDGLLYPDQTGLMSPLAGNVSNAFGLEDFAFSVGAMARITIQQFPFKIGFAKDFVIQNGSILPVSGDMFPTSGKPFSGLKLVLSLSQSVF